MENNHQVYKGGADAKDAHTGMIMLHGRGSDINDMKSVIPPLHLKGVHLAMPQAPFEIMPGRYAWYSHFWNENLNENLQQLEPSFQLIDHCLDEMLESGLKYEDIILFGHSQGANLILEYFTQFPKPVKAVLALRGCLLGEFTSDRNFDETLPKETKVIIHSGRKDPYIPAKKTDQTINLLKKLGANVFGKTFEAGHGICRPELMDIKKMFKSDFETVEA